VIHSCPDPGPRAGRPRLRVTGHLQKKAFTILLKFFFTTASRSDAMRAGGKFSEDWLRGVEQNNEDLLEFFALPV
jgi:hypothetical protein